ncbi:MAG: DegV family protein [Firmicutes bacterium]|nr:DegV family protein [Bacillota bacterium]
MSISIIVDILCEVPKSFITEYGIRVMPIMVH